MIKFVMIKFDLLFSSDNNFCFFFSCNNKNKYKNKILSIWILVLKFGVVEFSKAQYLWETLLVYLYFDVNVFYLKLDDEEFLKALYLWETFSVYLYFDENVSHLKLVAEEFLKALYLWQTLSVYLYLDENGSWNLI